MADVDLVKTGIAELDSILNGGIPRGNVIAVEGPAGSGKTTFGLEFIYRGASEFDEPGLIVLFEVSPLKLVRDAAQFGWDLTALERQGKIKIIFTTRSVLQQELQQSDSLLLAEASRIGAKRIFIDAMPPLHLNGQNAANGQTGVDAREMFHTLVEGLQRENLTPVLAVEASPLERVGETAQPIEEFLADTLISCESTTFSAPRPARLKSSNREATASRWAGTRFGLPPEAGSMSIVGCRLRGMWPARRHRPSTWRRVFPLAFPASTRS